MNQHSLPPFPVCRLFFFGIYGNKRKKIGDPLPFPPKCDGSLVERRVGAAIFLADKLPPLGIPLPKPYETISPLQSRFPRFPICGHGRDGVSPPSFFFPSALYDTIAFFPRRSGRVYGVLRLRFLLHSRHTFFTTSFFFSFGDLYFLSRSFQRIK